MRWASSELAIFGQHQRRGPEPRRPGRRRRRRWAPDAQDLASRRAFARALLDALRDRQVLAGLTGPEGTVLKVRPPLIWHTDHADLFAGALAGALAAVS